MSTNKGEVMGEGKLPRVGDRVRLVKAVENYPTCLIEAGEIGTVSEISFDSYWIKLEVNHPELDEWDNAVQIWDWSEEEGIEAHPSKSLEILG